MQFLKQYFGFVFGTFFGATVATVTTYYAVQFTYGDMPQVNALDIQECLIDKIQETNKKA